MRLEGKTALITGASRNIGREIAITFGREGADLVLNTRASQAELEEVATKCRELGVKVHTVIADVSDSDSVKKMVAEGIKELGKIDILVNNVAPGYLLTDRMMHIFETRSKGTGSSVEDLLQAHSDTIPVGRLGRPEELGDLVAFLSSEKNSYTTGSTILVDGGVVRSVM